MRRTDPVPARHREGSTAATRFAALTLAVLSLLVLGAGRARAQSAEAEALFNDADKLMGEGKTSEACDAFEASNRIEARAGTLIRLGDCRAKNQQLASAWSAYKDALSRVKDPKKREVATAALASIEPRLSYLTVSVPDASRVDGLELTRNGRPLDPGVWNRAIPVDGGDYAISARAPGHDPWTAKVTVPVESGKVTVDVPALAASAVVIAPAGGGDRTPAVTSAAEVEPSALTGRRKIAIGVGAAGVVALGLGLVEGLGASSDRDQAFMLCPDPQTPCARAKDAQAALDRGKSKALIANLGYGLGAAALIGAAVLWFTGAPEAGAGHVSVVPVITPSAAAVDVLVRF